MLPHFILFAQNVYKEYYITFRVQCLTFKNLFRISFSKDSSLVQSKTCSTTFFKSCFIVSRQNKNLHCTPHVLF